MAKQKTLSSLHFYRKVKFVIIFLNGYLDPGAVGVVVVVVFLEGGRGLCGYSLFITGIGNAVDVGNKRLVWREGKLCDDVYVCESRKGL